LSLARRGVLPRETFATERSNGWRRPSATARSSSHRCTNTWRTTRRRSN